MSEVAFVQALRENPADETIRLIFADFLEEQPDPALAARGELLRIETALSRWVPDLQQRMALQHRKQQLLAEHVSNWLGPVLPFCRSWDFKDGLVHLTMTAERFLSASFAGQAEALFQQTWVGSLRLEEVNASEASALVAAPSLRLLSSLDLSSNELDHAFVSALAHSPHLASLLDLNLSNNHLTWGIVPELLLSPQLGRLTRLDLRNNRIEGVAGEFLQNVLPDRFAILDLHGNEVPLPLVRRLARLGKVLRAGEWPTRTGNSLGMELALIPPGTFLMGSPDREFAAERIANGPVGADERPRHEVTLTSPFYLGVYPVTQRQYQELMGTNPSEFNAARGGGPDHPVEGVSWDDAYRFCERLSQQPEEQEAGRIYRLPTEAEWEHACRAGTTTVFSWGDSASSFQANFDGSRPYGNGSEGPYLQRTSRVGSYPANGFGLYDMHGNVWEWCADFYEQGYYAQSPPGDPQGPQPASNQRKVTRGGSWSSTGSECRSACRDFWYGTSFASHRVGFRVAMTWQPGGDNA